MKTIKTYDDFLAQRVINWIYETAGGGSRERSDLFTARLKRLDLTNQQVKSILAIVNEAFKNKEARKR